MWPLLFPMPGGRPLPDNLNMRKGEAGAEIRRIAGLLPELTLHAVFVIFENNR